MAIKTSQSVHTVGFKRAHVSVNVNQSGQCMNGMTDLQDMGAYYRPLINIIDLLATITNTSTVSANANQSGQYMNITTDSKDTGTHYRPLSTYIDLLAATKNSGHWTVHEQQQ